MEEKMRRFEDLLRRVDEALAAAGAGGEAAKIADLASKRGELERALTAAEEIWLDFGLAGRGGGMKRAGLPHPPSDRRIPPIGWSASMGYAARGTMSQAGFDPTRSANSRFTTLPRPLLV